MAKTKMELRYCKKCERPTIQVEAKRPMQTGYSSEELVRVWYCPNCGDWEYSTKEGLRIKRLG